MTPREWGREWWQWLTAWYYPRLNRAEIYGRWFRNNRKKV